MSKARPRSRKRKNQRHRKLTPLQKNEIVVLREMGHTFREICEKTQYGYGTVVATYSRAQSDPAEIRQARGEALIRAAKDTMHKALAAQEAITVADLKQERIEVRDDAGNLVDIRLRGPSPLQNATTFGILADKAMKFQDRGEELLAGGRPALNPDGLIGLISSLGTRLGKLKMIGLEIDLSELEEKLDTYKQCVDAEYTELPEDQ